MMIEPSGIAPAVPSPPPRVLGRVEESRSRRGFQGGGAVGDEGKESNALTYDALSWVPRCETCECDGCVTD